MSYQPKTGERCHCRRGMERDNCPACEGTGMKIDFATIRSEMKTYKITGNDAIRLAERDQLNIHCYANPIDDGGIVNVDTARQIAKDDANLIYATVTPRGWWDGRGIVSEMDGYNVSDYFTSSGMYLGPDDDGVEPRWGDAKEVCGN